MTPEKAEHRWTSADIADFEHLLDAESAIADQPRAIEDRTVYEADIAPRAAPRELENRRTVFRLWLAARRRQGRYYFPGEDLASTWKLFVVALATIAFFAGALLAGGLLVPDASGQVSAALVFMLTVGLQLGLTLATLLASGTLRALGAVFGTFPSIRTSVAAMLLRRLARSRHGKLRTTLSRLDGRQRQYRRLASLHVLVAAQGCFVAMSLGVASSLVCFHFLVKEYRFGWGMTHALTAQQVDAAVGVIALPWSWVAPGARPTLAQVQASRFDLDAKPPRLVDANASGAWAWFLVAAILCWGVLLRIALMALAALMIRKELRSLTFDHAEADALWVRLHTPLPAKPEEAATPAPAGPVQERSWWRRTGDALAFWR